jgi:UDP-N-acetylbacillosamine N-acetyltransferase
MTWDPVGIFDPDLFASGVRQVMGIPVLEERGLNECFSRATAAFPASGSAWVRQQMLRKIRDAGMHVPTLMHPQAVVDPSVEVGEGCLISAGAVIMGPTKIGSGVVVNTGAIVEHDTLVEDFAQVASGATLAGSVKIREGSLVAVGATIGMGVEIGAWSTIGAGSVVVRDIPGGWVAFGSPCKPRRERRPEDCSN